MRIRAPTPFRLHVKNRQGDYALRFERIDEWDGQFIVEGLGPVMTWRVLSIDQAGNRYLTLSGTTDGAVAACGEEYWFQADIGLHGAKITFWGDQVLIRSDDATIG